jgi:hypothetical protein
MSLAPAESMNSRRRLASTVIVSPGHSHASQIPDAGPVQSGSWAQRNSASPQKPKVHTPSHA